MDNHDLTISPLSRDFEKDGHRVRVEIYGSKSNEWILEVVDAAGTSTVWDDTFETDDLADQEFLRTVEKEGIETVSGPFDE